MTRTIQERIDAAIDEVDASTLGLQRSDIQEILQQHFAEPWLDAPDGPGHWWRKSDTSTSLMKLRGSDFEHWEGLQCKWQRVIGPSE